MTEEIVVFDVFADYAYFRRGYTTTSTLSYPFPSRTTISGLIACIMGYERDSYYNLFQKNNSKIGLKIINPINTTRINLNYINTKENMLLSAINKSGKRTQVPAEFLKNVRYRIYVSLDNKEVLYKLNDMINKHQSIYTPYLGNSECICNFESTYNQIMKAEKVSGTNVCIDSVVLKDNSQINIEPKKRYGVVKSPGFMNDDRSVSSFLEYYYESRGKSIQVKSAEYYEIGEDNVVLY